MSLSGKEKVWFLVDAILDKLETVAKGDPISLHFANDLREQYHSNEAETILRKLEREENAVKLRGVLSPHSSNEIPIELLPGFSKYVQKLNNNPEYLEFSGKEPSVGLANRIALAELAKKQLYIDTPNSLARPPKAKTQSQNQSSTHTITYTTSHEIILDNTYRLSRPNFNGLNERVFSILFDNQGKTFTKKELRELTGEKIDKSLGKIVENLGFTGDLRRMFFHVSKEAISFSATVSAEEIKSMQIGFINLRGKSTPD